MEKAKCFVFEGVKLECVQSRLLNSVIKREQEVLVITEFFQSVKSSKRLYQQNVSKVYTVNLPQELLCVRVIGKPLCISCHGNFFLFQFVQSNCRYIRFFVVDTDKGTLQIFDDSFRYFWRDFTSIGPHLAHISKDCQQILLGFHGHVIASRKWSKLLIVTKARSDHKDNLSDRFIGTQPCPVLNKLFQCIVFDHFNPSTIILALVDEFCSKCTFTIYDIEARAEIKQKVHRLGNRSVTITNSDSEDEEDNYFLLHDSSLILTRDGSKLILCCVSTDNTQKTWLKLFIYDIQSINFLYSHETVLPQLIFPMHKNQTLAWTMSTCDTELQLWRMQRGHVETDRLFCYRLRKPLELKSLCRSNILQNICIQSVKKLPLPQTLIQYLCFN